MLAQIEKELKSLKVAAIAPDVDFLTKTWNDKYRRIAAKNAMRLEIELDKIYAMYIKIRAYEEKVCKKFDIEIF